MEVLCAGSVYILELPKCAPFILNAMLLIACVLDKSQSKMLQSNFQLHNTGYSLQDGKSNYQFQKYQLDDD